MNQLGKDAVRDVRFGLDEGIPSDWYQGRPAVSLYFDNLSTLFPLGEAFFMRSVQHYRDRIDDEALRAEVRVFHAQEAMHSREHAAYNRMLKARGIDVEALEVGVARLLRIPHRFGPLGPRVALCVTMSLEHWTAMLGHLVLSEDAMFDGADPRMAALWRWHSAEEVEHKGVAIDVYRAIGGRYPLRAVMMVVTSVVFWARVAQQQHRMMRWAGLSRDRAAWADLARFLVVEQRVFQRLGPHWLAWFRPGFHPWDRDDRPLLARWRTRWSADLPWQRAAPVQPA